MPNSVMDGVNSLQQWPKTTQFNPVILFTILFISFVYVLTKLKTIKNNKTNSPPSPPKLPIIGNLHQINGLPALQSLSQKYGPLLLLHFGHVPTLLVSSAKVAQEILKTHDVTFSNRPRARAVDDLFFGSKDIVFSNYGEYWRKAKKVSVLELLSHKRVQEFGSLRSQEVEKVVEEVRVSCMNGAEINLTRIFLSFSYNVISKSAFGGVFDHKVSGGGKSFGELSRRAVELLGAFCFKDLYPSLGWLDYVTGLVRKLKVTSKQLNDFLDQVIDEHQAFDVKDKKDTVDILLHLHKEGLLDFHLSRDNLKGILMDMFVGGTDTTATTLEWAMAELVKNPSTLKKAQEEVRTVVGKKSKVSDTDINEMIYLKWVIKESLRLHPPSAVIIRESSQSVEVNGYEIPSKTRVLINAWKIQRDSQVWEKAEEFIPERFGEKSVDFKGGNAEFIPFGSGRRICPGMAFAVTQVELMLANLLYWFDWELPNAQTPQDLDMDEVFHLVAHKKTPLLLVPVLHFP